MVTIERPDLWLRNLSLAAAGLLSLMVVAEVTREPEAAVWCIEGEANNGDLQSGVEETAKRHGVYLGEGIAETLGWTIKRDIELGPHEQVGSQQIWIGLDGHRNPITAGPGECAPELPQPPTRPN